MADLSQPLRAANVPWTLSCDGFLPPGVPLKTHLSSPFTVAGLAIPGKEIDDAPGILEALHALGMTIVYRENTLELVFE